MNSARRHKMNKELYNEIRIQKKHRQKERNSYIEAITENISIASDSLKYMPVLTFHGRNSLIIENHKKILEYTNQCIRIQTRQYLIMLNGVDLKINYCTKEEMKITGYIENLIYQ